MPIDHPDRQTDVFICWAYLEVVIGLKHQIAVDVAMRMVEICKIRWPKAIIKCPPPQPDYLGNFIELGGEEAAAYVPQRDLNLKEWNNQGAVLKDSVVDEIFIEALELHRSFSVQEEAPFLCKFRSILRGLDQKGASRS
jgi:hypothetical protein